MAIFNLFSKRQKKLRGEEPDVFTYDQLPEQLRVQIVHIFQDAIGDDKYGNDHAGKIYRAVEHALCREYGLFELVKNARDSKSAVLNFFLNEPSIERALDVVESIFKALNHFRSDDSNYRFYLVNHSLTVEDAVSEFNLRCKEHGVGYQFESDELIKVDSQFVHTEAVKPTLALLREKGFQGANQEFLAAHEHYRHSRYKECLVDSLKAVESTLKAICKKRGWKTQPNDTAKALLAICFNNGLLPQYLETQFSSLRQLLESGVPTIRNKNGGHGQGVEPIVVPQYLAQYALNLTATTILFLVAANRGK